MTIMFSDEMLKTLDDIRKFLMNPLITSPAADTKPFDRAFWIWERLVRFKYMALKRPDRTVLVRYLVQMTGLCVKQVGRHIAAYKLGKKPRNEVGKTRHRFNKKYTQSDIDLLTVVDRANTVLSGTLTKKFLENEHAMRQEQQALQPEKDPKKQLEFHTLSRLKDISVAHLYRLRATKHYRAQVISVSKTKSSRTPVSIGTRKKPQPKGMPGFIRVDTVHQGDLMDEKTGKLTKGVYHINLVDEVTQWEVVIAVETISEHFLIPVLKMALECFPFVLHNFHSDNGSEFINGMVRDLLVELNMEQTKSRARRSTDNGLIECKNGAIIRKELGHWHIEKVAAKHINIFYQEHLVPYLNFHRPCHFPEKVQQSNGKIIIKYPQHLIKTPYQKLLSLSNWQHYLKPGYTPERLQRESTNKTPLRAAQEKKKARDTLMKLVLTKHSDTMRADLPLLSDE